MSATPLKSPETALTAQEIEPVFYQQFIAYLDTSEKTTATYTKALKQLDTYLAEQGIARPTRETIIAYKDALIDQGKSAATVQLYITAARLFFRWTAQAGLYPDISEHIKTPRITKGFKKDYLTAEQIKAILSGIDRTAPAGLRDYAMLALMVTAGLRDIEVSRANVKDLRALGSNTVLYIQGKGRTDKSDYVKISRPVEAAIRAYMATRKRPAGRDPLFTSQSNNSRGNRLSTRSISGTVKSRLCAAGYDSDRLTAHSLRHTAITLALLSGEKIDQVASFARHASISTTMIYNHALDLAANTCADDITKAIF